MGVYIGIMEKKIDPTITGSMYFQCGEALFLLHSTRSAIFDMKKFVVV